MKQRQQIWVSISCYAIMIAAVGTLPDRALAKGTGKDGEYFSLLTEKTKADKHKYIRRIIAASKPVQRGKPRISGAIRFGVPNTEVNTGQYKAPSHGYSAFEYSGKECSANYTYQIISLKPPFRPRNIQYRWNYSDISDVSSGEAGSLSLLGVVQVKMTNERGSIPWSPERAGVDMVVKSQRGLKKALEHLTKKCGGGN